MDVQLTAEESGALQRALRTYCADLRMEIIATDNPAYRRELREDRAVLESVIGKLGAEATASSLPMTDSSTARSSRSSRR